MVDPALRLEALLRCDEAPGLRVALTRRLDLGGGVMEVILPLWSESVLPLRAFDLFCQKRGNIDPVWRFRFTESVVVCDAVE